MGGALKGKRMVIIDDEGTAGTGRSGRRLSCNVRREDGTLVGIIVALGWREKMPAGAGGKMEMMESRGRVRLGRSGGSVGYRC